MAPRVSLRLSRVFRRAIWAAANTRIQINVRERICPARAPAPVSASCMRVGRVQGEIVWKETGLPRQEAASTRSEIFGALGYTPVHAARASNPASGLQRGSAGWNLAGSSPAAAKSAFQSVAGGGPLLWSICGGTALK